MMIVQSAMSNKYVKGDVTESEKNIASLNEISNKIGTEKNIFHFNIVDKNSNCTLSSTNSVQLPRLLGSFDKELLAQLSLT
jgi:hypothetical protein